MIENKKIILGQVFTPEPIVKFMIEQLSQHKDSKILEPSSGNGAFLNELNKQGFENIDAYEIDKDIISHSFVKNKSFISSEDVPIYDAIIGNPPYIRWKNLDPKQKIELKNNNLWKKYCNSLCDLFYIFILKSILQLKQSGELIFIVPDYWLSTKNSHNLRKFLINNGSFKKIILFNETKLFKGVSSSIMIFHYIKDIKLDKIEITNLPSNITIKDNRFIENGETYFIEQFNSHDNWVVSPPEITKELKKLENICIKHNKHENNSYTKIGDVCDIGNGMVSGLDKAFQMTSEYYTLYELQNSIKVAKAKHLDAFIINNSVNYIFIENKIDESLLKNDFPNFYTDLNIYKDKLNNRYNYNKNIPYWEWSFPRNVNLFKRNEYKIFVPCKERISHKSYFRFSLSDKDVFPTQDVTALYKKNHVRESIEYILAYLNSNAVFHWIKHKGVIRGDVVEFSEKPLSSIPFREINWDIPEEIEIHNNITKMVKDYIKTKNKSLIHDIHFNLSKLGVDLNL